jgi:hypothetical protein
MPRKPVQNGHQNSVFAGFRFPAEVISAAVRWYLRYGLPHRDVEELLAERGVTADPGARDSASPPLTPGARLAREGTDRPHYVTDWSVT